jgi:hypothetical protein
MMIAARVFTDTARQSMEIYPADTIFGKASIHQGENRSEWNSSDAFYYTSSTSSIPLNYNTLQHIAGTGSSEVIKCSGNGAYFLDRLSPGVWRLECMPDVVELQDPFGRAAALDRKVRQLEWNERSVTVELPELGTDFQVDAVNKGNQMSFRTDGKSFLVSPGVYVLRAKGKSMPGKNSVHNGIRVDEFVAPLPTVGAAVENKTPLISTGTSAAGDIFPIRQIRNQLMLKNPDWRSYKISYPGDSIMEIQVSDSSTGRLFAWHTYVGGMVPDNLNATALRIQLTATVPTSFRFGLVDIYGTSYFKECRSDSTGVIDIPLSTLKPGPSLLLPRPYPGFLPLWFDNKLPAVFRIDKVDKLEFLFYSDGVARTISIAGISLH